MSPRVPRLLVLSCALGLALAPPSAAHAQRVHVLAVTGLSGEPAYRLLFESAASALVDSARARWRVADSSSILLAEDLNSTRLYAKGRATKDAIAQSFLTLSRRVAPGDIVLVFLVGHGSGPQGDSHGFGLPPRGWRQGSPLNIRVLPRINNISALLARADFRRCPRSRGWP